MMSPTSRVGRAMPAVLLTALWLAGTAALSQDSVCGEPLPDSLTTASTAQPPRPATDRSAVDRATIHQSAIKQLFTKEPLLALVLAGSVDYDKSGASFLSLEPSNGGTFAYGGGYYRYQLQFKKLSEDQIQFRFTVREAKENGVQTTFVGDLLSQGTAATYTRIHLDANGNLIDRTNVTWKAP